MNAAHALLQSLDSHSIRYVFGVPGEENLDILDALKDTPNVQFILTRHEQAAGFMAATVGKLTGVPGVALSTLGPGATNLVTAAAYAQLGGMPLLMITGQKPVRTDYQGAFQIIDIIDMMNPLTKSATQLNDGRLTAAKVRDAVRLASEERPGATLIEVPEDIAAETIDFKPLPLSTPRRPIAEHKAIDQLIELLKQSKRPLLIIGAGANRKRTSRMLTEFVKRYNIPFVSTQLGKGVIDETMPQFAGTAALSAGDYVHDTIELADLVINVGHDSVEKPPFNMTGDRPVVHLNFETASVSTIYFPQLEVIGDIANAIWQLDQALELDDMAWDTQYHVAAKSALDDSFTRQLEKADTLTPQVIVDRVRRAVPSDGIVTLDNGMYKIWFARHYIAHHENTLLLDNALATMGAGLPSAIACALVYPDKPIVCVAGDGGFMMNSQELETAVRLKLNIVILVLNDSALQMIRWKQAKQNRADFGLSFGNPDFVLYAESYGATGHRATTPDGLSRLMKQSQTAGGIHVIDVAIDYSSSADDLAKRT